ncbi:hypothetical protein HY523_00225, partial [Candidatus Berkelbacteria bacterium]|nr:hypothetical protein [Candidatus Berkelbacteria bacterium]
MTTENNPGTPNLNATLVAMKDATKVAIRALRSRGAEHIAAVKAIKDELAAQLVAFHAEATEGAPTTLLSGGETLRRVVPLVDFGGPIPVILPFGQQVLVLTEEGQPQTCIGNWEDFIDRYVVAAVPLGV